VLGAPAVEPFDSAAVVPYRSVRPSGEN